MFIPSEETRFRNFAAHLSCFSRPNDHMQRSREAEVVFARRSRASAEENNATREIGENDVKNTTVFMLLQTPLIVIMFRNGRFFYSMTK